MEGRYAVEKNRLHKNLSEPFSRHVILASFFDLQYHISMMCEVTTTASAFLFTLSINITFTPLRHADDEHLV